MVRHLSKLLTRRVCSKLLRINWTSQELPQRAPMTTSGIQNAKDTCLPPPAPPQGLPSCELPKKDKHELCKLQKQPVWKGCDKICMPCCCPAVIPPDCDELDVRVNTCKRNEYRIPSYTECRKEPFDKIGPQFKKECCYSPVPCGGLSMTGIEPLISTKVRQEMLLGRHKRDDQKRYMTTSAVHFKAGKEDCKKQSALPCLKPISTSNNQPKGSASDKKQCEKMCMPCCVPARDPPDCYYPYERKECKRRRAPRPAYSECKKAEPKPIRPCECQIPRLPPCEAHAEEEGGKGCN